MAVTLRKFTLEDAEVCGVICYEAFKKIGEEHNFPSGWDSPEQTIAVLTAMGRQTKTYGVVAEADGRVAGSNFLDERSPLIAGIGPITVDPAVQNGTIGRQL